MSAFLFARALNRTAQFRLASNVDGVGAFDDLVFRYKLREPDVWKTCFIQLKHKDKRGEIQLSCLTKMTGDFSLWEYFKSYCEIRNNAATKRSREQFGNLDEFEFVIYTNGNIGNTPSLQGGESDPLSILSSGTDKGKYITFDKDNDKHISDFFGGIKKYHEHIKKLEIQLKERASGNVIIKETIKELKDSLKNEKISKNLNRLEEEVKTDCVPEWIEKEAKCAIDEYEKVYEEFLNKFKIFQTQSNVNSLERLIEKELQDACKGLHSVANFIYTKFEGGISKWCERVREVEWLNENSKPWQEVQEYIINEIERISEPELQEIDGYGTCFNQQHLQKLSDAIKENTVLNIVTNAKNHISQKSNTYQVLTDLGYENSLFIGKKSLIFPNKNFKNLWPSKWCRVLVVDCGADVACTFLESLLKSPDGGQGLDINDDNRAESLFGILQKYEQKIILISPKINISNSQKELRNIFTYFEDNFEISD